MIGSGNMKKILTGLQPTGAITLGNYIGAISQMKKLQDKYDSYIFVANMHAITVPIDPEQLRKNIKSLVALYLACGIDKDKNTIFVQSDNLYHANLSWVLECNTYYGELSRMTQFKDKSSKNVNFTSGLLTYPVLMASDILLYDVDYVPIGIDQKQHLEITRDIADRFNKKYGNTFKLPKPLISESGTKIMDLVNPAIKMSKSAENKKGVIYLLDDLDVIRKKIMGATTDSEMVVKYDVSNKPGISNLINIYASLTGKNIEEVEEEFRGKNYGEFKTKKGCTLTLVDDYGHHPTEVDATIKATRQAYPDKKLVMVFQPHRYTRTRDCYEDFVRVLQQVDKLILVDVYPAGETPIPGADGRHLCMSIRLQGKIEPHFVQTVDEVPALLEELVEDNSLVLTQGAGNVVQVARNLSQIWEKI